MKGLFSLFMLFSAVLAVTFADLISAPKPRPDKSGFPGLPPFNPRPIPGTGPFSPGPVRPDVLLRLRRSPDDDQNKITVNANKEGNKSSYQIEYERKIYENKYGSIGANVGVNKDPYSKPETQVGISGSFHW